MKFKVKNIDIGTGGIPVGVLTLKDASKLDLYPADRVIIKKRYKHTVVSLDVLGGLSQKRNGFKNSNDKRKKMLKPGEIGIFHEVQKLLETKDGDTVDIIIEKKPESIELIKKKLEGRRLSSKEMYTVINDINQGKLTDIEIAYFVSACYMHELSMKEIAALTNAMVYTGKQLKLKQKIIVDKHCIGGVAGNRTSIVIVPILAAGGLTIPKTSSRSITSAAGTSDTVEVLCPVEFSINEMRNIVKKTKGCLVWGGAVNLAPADDKIIKIEYPVSLDPAGQLLASIMAKKKSVSATHVLIDVPVGKGAKIESMQKAKELKRNFEILAKLINIKIDVIITDGSFPVGRGIGPALEARDIISLFQGSDLCHALREKSIMMAGKLFDLAGKTKKGHGQCYARYLLESGKAEKKFWEIVKAQGGKKINVDDIRLARETYAFIAKTGGRVAHINNQLINKIARIAGAPLDKEAGLYLHKQRDEVVRKGDSLFTIYSDSKERLRYARQIAESSVVYTIKK